MTDENLEQLKRQCYNKSGVLSDVREIVEQPSPVICTGQRPTVQPQRHGDVAIVHGKYDRRACVTAPPGKVASALWCQMSDGYQGPTGTLWCDIRGTSDGTCPYMHSIAVLQSVSNGVHRYCWVFHSQDVKRPRDFILHGDFVDAPTSPSPAASGSANSDSGAGAESRAPVKFSG